MTDSSDTPIVDDFVVHLVDVQTEARLHLGRLLEANGWRVKHYAAGAILLRALDRFTPGVVVSGKILTPRSVYPGVPVAPATPANALKLLLALKAQDPSLPFILYDDAITVKEAVHLMEEGAFTVIERPDFEALTRALTRAQSPNVTDYNETQQFLFGWQHLTERERAVAKYLARGMSNREIAETLGGLSPKTVQAHCSEIFKKTDCHGRVRVVKMMKALAGQQAMNVSS